MFRYIRLLRHAIWRGMEHGIFATAKAAAYSAILTVFPTLIVLAWLFAETHTGARYTAQLIGLLDRVLPPGTHDSALDYLQGTHKRPLKEMYSAVTVMVTAASGVMISWMDGFRRAYNLEFEWPFWRQRLVAFFLVFLGFAPMAFAFSLIAFGNQIETWIALHLDKEVGYWVLLMWALLRWAIAAVTSILVVMLVYHWALPRVQPFRKVLPGAVLVTILWFPFTVLFGWYVTKYATYNLIYGPLAAAIALLVWMYVLSIIILVGAEYNAQVCPRAECELPDAASRQSLAEATARE